MRTYKAPKTELKRQFEKREFRQFRLLNCTTMHGAKNVLKNANTSCTTDKSEKKGIEDQHIAVGHTQNYT